MMWLRQMAQLSTTMSQAQRATAFHWSITVLLSKPKIMSRCESSVCTDLLYLETLLAITLGLDITTLLLDHSARGAGRIGHIDVRHVARMLFVLRALLDSVDRLC
jgi:hypothetical protein